MKSFLIAALWVATLGASFWVGRALSPSQENVESPAKANKPLATQVKVTPGKKDVAATTETESTTDVLGVFEALTASEEGVLDWEALESTVAQMRPWEAEAALDALMQTPAGQQRDRMMIDLLELWAKQSPQQALAYLPNIASLRLRENASEGILEIWGSNDVSSAMNWLNDNMQDAPARTLNQSILAVLEGYAQSDPSGAFVYSAALPDDTAAQRNIKHRALEEAADQLVQSNRVAEALALAQTLPEGSSRNDIFSEIIGEWAEYDPAMAAQHLDVMGPDAVPEAQRELMRSWAEYDPVAAAGWLSSLPAESENSGRLVTELIGRWTRYDLDASAAWLNQIPPSPEIDRAVAIYTYRSAQEDPASAMSWAESITREDYRERLMERVATEWKQQDPEAFQTYINESQLTTEQKEKLQNAQSNGWGGRRWARD